MRIRDAVLAAAVLKVLADEISGQLQAAKAAAERGFRDTGTSSAPVFLPDGTKAATATLAGEDGKSAVVTDSRALLEWVQAHHPGETEVVIRDGYRKKLMDTAKAEGRAIDPATGELVPGIAVIDSKPYVSLRFRTGGKDAVVAAWRRGELRDIGVVAPAQIEGGEAA